MSLKEFHILFVGAAILCTIAFGSWAVQQYIQSRSFGYLTTAWGAFLIGLSLVIYEILFIRKVKGL